MNSEIYNDIKNFLLNIDTSSQWELKSCNQEEIFMQKKFHQLDQIHLDFKDNKYIHMVLPLNNSSYSFYKKTLYNNDSVVFFKKYINNIINV